MSCLRCQGFVCCERLHKNGLWWWRCVNCGDRVDAIILKNRSAQEAERAAIRLDQQRDLKEWSSWFAKMPANQCASSPSA